MDRNKWFFADGEVEVFVNFDLAGKQGEFAEKDEGYRAGLVAAFATLRDGAAK